MDTPVPPLSASVIIHVDHRDLSLAYAQQHISARAYALEVMYRARTPNGFLDGVDEASILRLVPGLPAEVAESMDGEPLARLIRDVLGLTVHHPGDRARIVSQRLTFLPSQFFLDLDAMPEVLVIEPHHDRARPGRMFVGWIADADAPDTSSGGTWYGATPMAVLVAMVDDLHQVVLDDTQE